MSVHTIILIGIVIRNLPDSIFCPPHKDKYGEHKHEHCYIEPFHLSELEVDKLLRGTIGHPHPCNKEIIDTNSY